MTGQFGDSTSIKKTKMAGSHYDSVPNKDINIMTKCSACHRFCTNTVAQVLECCAVTTSYKNYEMVSKQHNYSSDESSTDSGTC